MKEIQSYEAQKQEGILLNANELYKTASDEIIEEVKEALSDIAFNRYPDMENKELIQAYGNVMNIQSNKILAGNGSDEMLGLLIGYFLGKGKRLYTLDPDFSMYDYYASMHEADVVKYTCFEDGAFDVDKFIQDGKEKSVNMILFSNPNNPTGHAINRKVIDKILYAFPDIPVIIDEAYGEFASESMLQCVDQYENLYVTRTLSKAYGLAGARLGFLISNVKNIQELKPYVVPYNISSFTQKIGVIVLRHAKEYQPIVRDTIEQREKMFQKLKDLKTVRFYPSQANYLYGRCACKDKLLQAFEEKQIVIRNYKGSDSFRITIGSKEQNKLVMDVLLQFDKEEHVCEV